MRKFSFPKKLRLRTRYDYKRMASRCKRFSGAFFTIEVRKNDSAVTRLGITVTKRFGDAHCRNRFKRVVREGFRLCYSELVKGLDLNVRPLNGCFELTMPQAQAELLRFLKLDNSQVPL